MTAFCCSPWGRPPACGGLSGRLGRLAQGAGSLLPGAALILLPKCPLCLAAWIAAGAGVALPAAVIATIRPSLTIVCILSALLLVRRAISRFRLRLSANR